MTKPLTDAEIAELRAALAADDGTSAAQEEIADAAARLAMPRLLDEVERARALLRRIEWSGSPDGDKACPECSADGNGPPLEHRPDCELAALLGGAGGEQDPQKT